MQQILSKDDIATLAPAVFTKSKHERTSDKYTFIPTEKIIKDLKEQDWLPVHATTVRARAQSIEHAKHLLRFRAKENITVKHSKSGDIVIPELVITNSHDGKNAFCAHIGVFRQVCSNGLLVEDGVAGGFRSMRITHKGYDENTALEMINHTIDGFTEVLKSIDDYRETKLTVDEQLEFAEAAINLRWKYDYIRPHGITPEMYIVPHRLEDKERTLWNTFNTVQEHMARGGVVAHNQEGRQIRTRPIKNIREELRFNKELWGLLANTFEEVK